MDGVKEAVIFVELGCLQRESKMFETVFYEL